MKHMKRIFALALAVMMLLSLAITASAAEGDPATYSVTINNATNHNYVIYQIFTGDLSKKTVDGKEVDVLSNIKYGENYGTEGEEVPESELNNFDPTTITPTGEGKPMTTTGTTATIDGLVAGYYMIKDVTTTLPEGEDISAVIFQVVENTTVTSKHPKTTIIKKVQDINDSTGEYTKNGEDTWIDSADYDINDTVPFKSTATFAGLSNYDNYKVIFTDIMAEGLDYNRDMVVKVNGTPHTDSFTITFADYTNAEDPDYNNGTQITVTCDDITALIGQDADTAEIVLEYSATLNSKAKLGAPGNPNKIKVTTKPDGSGETPWDVNIVFTYKVEADKYTTVDGQEVALQGANFTLYKEAADPETEGAKTGTAIKAELAEKDPSIKADALKNSAYYVIAAEVETDAEGDTFSFKGVDDGNYVLVETQIPAGYNAWDAKAFTVTAEHEVIADDPDLTSLTGGDLFTGAVDTGILHTKVENKSGTVLPETGGIGTTIFYTVGAIMVLVAVVLLVTKKRMASAE